MTRPTRFLLQALAYAVFLGAIGLLSSQPSIRLIAEDRAILRLVFSHAGNRIAECRGLTQQELDEMPPNMRRPMECPRERLPLYVSLTIDGDRLYEATVPPTGIWGDGEAMVNRSFELPAGRHEVEVSMRDSDRETGFDYQFARTVNLEPRDNLVIGFNGDRERFTIAGNRP